MRAPSSGLSGLVASAGTLLRRRGGFIYLLRALFGTPASAPLTSPWEGLTLVQLDGQFNTDTVPGKLSFPAQTTPVFGEQGAYDPTGRSRVAGRTFISALLKNTTATNAPFLGWLTSGSVARSAISGRALYFAPSAALLVVDTAGAGPSVGSYAASTEYQIACILRSTGEFILIKGGIYTNWTLLWVNDTGSTATIYAAFSNYDASGTLDNFRVLDLPSFSTDAQVYTNRLVSPTAGATTTSTADAVVEWTFSYTGSECNIRVRRTDDNNHWRVAAAGGTLHLQEMAAGVFTSRASIGAVFTATNTYRVVVVMEAAVIKIYVNNVLQTTYSSATSNQTQTGIQVNLISGGVSELVAWPRVVNLGAV